jgi:alanyl-tRNA synthetase
MKSLEIRQSFFDFFKKYDHKVVTSAPVVPLDDPTLLFTNAGMNQFKDVFLGIGTRPYKRAVDSQKCIRVSGKHNDLEEVGHDTYHHTFFEMLGNWSFGDYYKKEAILWAWELITKIWGLPKSQLRATVFREDDEAEQLWKKMTDINPSHILRFDEKDNFWEMGQTGPCGPCSEIHIDLGEDLCDRRHIKKHKCKVNSGCARYIEIWNLVFIQYNRDESRKLHLLPAKHVDTGMGFERVTAVLQDKRSNYQTDLFEPIIEQISKITGKQWSEESTKPAFRVISDHIRALTFAITDGALPSNDGRGYVLRRLLRRAARYGRNLGIEEPFIYRLVSSVVNVLGTAYPEIQKRAQHTTHVIKAEEERFNEALNRGIEIFEKLVHDANLRGQKKLSGKDAFRLYDTYGFPVDLTQLMAKEKDLEVDITEFQKMMDEQKKRARENQKFVAVDLGNWEIITEGQDSEFVGYETATATSEVRKVRQEDDQTIILLSKTPFYGESGGQVGDQGDIIGDDFHIKIIDTQKQGDMILHVGYYTNGDNIKSPIVEAKVANHLRLSTARNHTATHLLHKALKEILGDHINQAGSMVAPERLRFDFTHFEAMNSEQINEVEGRVNFHIRVNHHVEKFVTSLQKAKEEGATALFGEKYEDKVRVIKIDDYSMELCGGTHLNSTGEIGYFRIVNEEGIAAGVRRIEAVTGESADNLLRKEKTILHNIESLLKCRNDEIEDRIKNLLEERKSLERKIKHVHEVSASSEIDGIINNAKRINNIGIVSTRIQVNSIDELRSIGDYLRGRLNSGVGVLGTVIGEKVNFLCVVTDDLIREKNLKAGEIVGQVAQIIQGSGGGKPHLALAGGKNKEKFQEALDSVTDIVKQLLLKNESDTE